METRLIYIPSVGTAFKSIKAAFSFERFAEYVEAGLSAKGAMQRNVYRFLRKQLAQHQELSGPIPADTIYQYDDLLQMMYISLTGISTPEEESLWAIGMPVPGAILYGTDALYALMEEELVNSDDDAMVDEYLASVYSLILKECYGFDTFLYERMLHSISDRNDGHQKHYRVMMDTRFIKLTCSSALPELSLEVLEGHIHKGSAISFLSEQLPLHQFCFTGFSIISMCNETATFAIQNIKNLLLENVAPAKNDYISDLIQSLQSLVSNGAIDFGFFPFVELNGKFLLQFEDISQSIVLNPDRPLEETEAILLPFIQRFAKHPEPIFIKDLEAMHNHRSALVQDFRQTGYRALALVPLYYNRQLVGILEICTNKENILSQRAIAKLDPVLPYLAQMLKRSVDDFHAKLARTINEKFTAIQPSVQWKFKEVVRAYLREDWQNKPAVLASVRFEHVAPFYGAIDIRNSTLERSLARCRDLESQFDLVIPLLFELRKVSGMSLPTELLLKMNDLLEGQWYPLSPEHEGQTAHFFLAEVYPFLIHFKERHNTVSDIIDAYLAKVDPQSGLLNHHKSILEESIREITDLVNNNLNKLSEDLQQIHTCYFESYLSDGMEYDVYAGDSITPYKTFDQELMAAFRLRQLQSMVDITRLTHARRPKMRIPLQTTQLIFIHDELVDIGYREKERRFDIDNVYHLRYQIIKKRLDKAEIKDTGERLTQPGKIAIVFSQSADSEPYLSLVKSLQESGALGHVERVKLEDLQGIGGLKALLVDVRLH